MGDADLLSISYLGKPFPLLTLRVTYPAIMGGTLVDRTEYSTREPAMIGA